MIKLVYCVRRRAEVSEDEFRRYWLQQHGPLVRSVAEAILARRYVQSHTFAPEANQAIARSRGLADGYDGITEVWWDDLDTYRAGFATPAGLNARNASLPATQRHFPFVDVATACNSRLTSGIAASTFRSIG